MTVDIGICKDDSRVVDKSFEVKKSVAYKIKQPSTVINPVLVVDYDDALLTCNYLYVAKWKRYYYIDNIEILNGERMQINCSVDVLNSFKTEIGGITCVVERQEVLNSKYFADPNVPVMSGRWINEYKVGSLTGSAYIMTVNGG